MKDAKLGLRDMDYICTIGSDDMLYEDRNIVESHGEFQDHTSTEYEVDKNTDIVQKAWFLIQRMLKLHIIVTQLLSVHQTNTV